MFYLADVRSGIYFGVNDTLETYYDIYLLNKPSYLLYYLQFMVRTLDRLIFMELKHSRTRKERES